MWPMFLAPALSAVLSAEPFSEVEKVDGVRLEVQKVAGSSFENLRVTVRSTAAPQALLGVIWGKADGQGAAPEVVRRDCLDDSANERTYYELIRAPVVSDRDFVMHSVKAEDVEAQVFSVTFHTVNDPRRPPSADVVRMPRAEGSAVVTQDGAGSLLVYTIFTDIGGSLPAFVARGAQRKSAVGWVKEMIKRAGGTVSK